MKAPVAIGIEACTDRLDDKLIENCTHDYIATMRGISSFMQLFCDIYDDNSTTNTKLESKDSSESEEISINP